MKAVTGKVAFITGGASGIGLGMAGAQEAQPRSDRIAHAKTGFGGRNS